MDGVKRGRNGRMGRWAHPFFPSVVALTVRVVAVRSALPKQKDFTTRVGPTVMGRPEAIRGLRSS